MIGLWGVAPCPPNQSPYIHITHVSRVRAASYAENSNASEGRSRNLVSDEVATETASEGWEGTVRESMGADTKANTQGTGSALEPGHKAPLESLA